MLLNTENYKTGFLIDDEVIAGVTEMNDAGATRLFAAYVSHYATGETYAYQEFEQIEGALKFLATLKRPWSYEAVGCSTGGCGTKDSTAASPTAEGCASGGCGCK